MADFTAFMVEISEPQSPQTFGVFWPARQPVETSKEFTPTTITHTTGALDPLSTATSTFTTSTPFIINHIQTSVPARVRIYASPAYRDSDLSRDITTPPSGDHGLLLEVVTTAGQLSYGVSPGVDGWVVDLAAGISVQNLSDSAGVVTVTLGTIQT